VSVDSDATRVGLDFELSPGIPSFAIDSFRPFGSQIDARSFVGTHVSCSVHVHTSPFLE
jgi:hypothetical protein